MSFPSISPKQSFPALESEVLAYWKANNTFKKSIESRPEDNPYRFYDGPPFITGTPHYGSLLSSIVKDVVGRYWTMRGRRVDRVWGWDCHGLPIEEKVQKKLGLKSNKEIEERGVKEFIDGCYEYTQSTSAEWDWYIDKIGRWVDMDRAYRTMDQDYMESVMWVFSQLWEKGLIYEGKRVSLYSWKLGTPISNFEVAMDDTYQEVNDPAITVKFKLEPNDKFPEGTQVLAWTTTPWTIPANMALAVRNDIDYVLVSLPSLQRGMSEGQGDLVSGKSEQNPQSLRDSSFAKELTEQFIVAKNRAENVFKGKGEYVLEREFKGSELVGLGYIPPFPEYYYKKVDTNTYTNTIENKNVSETEKNSSVSVSSVSVTGSKNHKIYHADFITDTDGTGIGHEAPEFGDVDFQLAKKEGIFISEAMDEAGKYTSQIFDYEGTHYLDLENPEKGANKINIERMKANGTLFKLEGITHRVPFCPRSGTPLVQKAQASWFIDIQSQKEKLLKANEQINWFPEHLKFGRFAKGIESAPDWCISRTRYWGAPMPVWQTKDASERVVVSSREEIYEMNRPYGQLTKVIFVRHGRTDYNGKFADVVGKAELIDDAHIHIENLKKSLADTKIDAIYSSPLKRCIDTITPLATQKNIAVTIDQDLIEVQMHSAQDRDSKYLDEQLKTTTATVAGDESLDELFVRSEKLLKKLVSENAGKTIVICSHFATIAALEKCLHHFDWDSEWTKYAPSNLTTKKNYTPMKVEYIFSDTCTAFNLHKPYIDSIKLQSPKTGEELTRIPEVLDVWMDSGSMPYAQMHYPFENKGEMEASFPADFIAEYVGQVRAWFYVMHVLGVLLMSKEDTNTHTNTEENTIVPGTKNNSDVSVSSVTVTPSFTNVITTGVINGNDGRKMSKSYGNYPDPRATIEKYGADPIRFYMLNSPLLSGGDMDFKEEQIIDTVKGVMLPLWNTYSFFTTYANIDNWSPDGTEVWFTRHAESTSNVANRMSDSSDDPVLTEKGVMQAHEAGKSLRSQGKNFDIIIHTSKIRATHTAKSIAEEIGFTGEYIVDDRFAEQDAGEFAGKTHEEMLSQYNAKTGKNIEFSHENIRRIYKEEGGENIDTFTSRIIPAYEDILVKYKGKRILIVAHAGTVRPILDRYFGKGKEYAHFHGSVKNAEPFLLPTTPLMNELDRWILSKLQVLLGQVHDAMDGYDVSRACRAIVDYMDHLTNWYVRLSRRRFWESGMTDDKKSAYSTLHTVLVELSKLMAPFMPFIAESVFQGLTKKESVHLEYVTFPNRHLIDNDLNLHMEKCEHIVSLGLALRSSKNIRVRQPLQSVTITAELSEYYQNIIRDELNVKDIKLENPEKLAKKIAKPDAKKIGPKYGKEVQYIIQQAKSGNFIENEDGTIVIPANAGILDSEERFRDKPGMTETGFILEAGEYTLEYLPLEGVGDVIGGYGMVVAMDTSITDELKLEGYARDIIRLIQDMRKEANYNVTDRILLSIIGEESETIKTRFGGMIESETLSTLVPQIDTPDTMREEAIDEDNVVQIAIKR